MHKYFNMYLLSFSLTFYQGKFQAQSKIETCLLNYLDSRHFTVLVLSHFQLFIYPSIHPSSHLALFLMHFKVTCRHLVLFPLHTSTCMTLASSVFADSMSPSDIAFASMKSTTLKKTFAAFWPMYPSPPRDLEYYYPPSMFSCAPYQSVSTSILPQPILMLCMIAIIHQSRWCI